MAKLLPFPTERKARFTVYVNQVKAETFEHNLSRVITGYQDTGEDIHHNYAHVEALDNYSDECCLECDYGYKIGATEDEDIHPNTPVVFSMGAGDVGYAEAFSADTFAYFKDNTLNRADFENILESKLRDWRASHLEIGWDIVA